MKESWYDKIYVLDANVLLHEASAIYQFQDNLVVIPMVVIEELDTFKKEQDETGRNSRQFSRLVDKLRSVGKIATGVQIREGSGYLKVDMEDHLDKHMVRFDKKSNDNKILGTALKYQAEFPEKKVVLVSKDINLRIKADLCDIPCEDYSHDKVDTDDLYTGMTVVGVDKSVIDGFYANGSVSREDWEEMPQLKANQYILLKNGANKRGLCRFDKKEGRLVPLRLPEGGIWGIKPKNLEQKIAFDLLLNEDIKLVSLVGKAGTGKTLLAVAAGLLKSVDEQRYKKLIVSRPIIPMGKDLGYLPGDINEKMGPWMKPIMDSVDFLLSGNKGQGNSGTTAKGKELLEQGMMEIEPLTYIRGRSIPHQYIILDESQNLTPHEIKTIITRVGEGTKIVLTGDCFQIDSPFLDATSNGLAYVVNKFSDEEIAGHITLIKGERSELAEIATNIL